MSHKEQKLLDLIFSDRNPAEALDIALEIIFDIAERSEVSQSPRLVEHL